MVNEHNPGNVETMGGAYARYRPLYAKVPDWCQISGMGRTSTYEALGRGDIRAVKVGTRTLIDVVHGLEWLASLPPAEIYAPGAKHPSRAAQTKTPGAGHGGGS